MKTHQFAIPNQIEVEDFFGKMKRFAPEQEPTELCINVEQNPKRAVIVLDNNSRNTGIVQSIYGKLE